MTQRRTLQIFAHHPPRAGRCARRPSRPARSQCVAPVSRHATRHTTISSSVSMSNCRCTSTGAPLTSSTPGTPPRGRCTSPRCGDRCTRPTARVLVGGQTRPEAVEHLAFPFAAPQVRPAVGPETRLQPLKLLVSIVLVDQGPEAVGRGGRQRRDRSDDRGRGLLRCAVVVSGEHFVGVDMLVGGHVKVRKSGRVS